MKKLHTLFLYLATGLLAGLSGAALGQVPAEPVYHGASLSEWIKKLGSEDPDERREAKSAITEIGPRAVPALRKTLAETKGRSQVGAAEALGAFKADARDAVPELTAALSATDERVRWRASAALRAIGPDAAAAVPALIGALAHDSDSREAKMARSALVAIGSATLEPLVRTLKTDRNPQLRRAAADTLGYFPKSAAAELLPPLLAAADDSDKDLRKAAGYAIGKLAEYLLDSKDPKIITQLEACLECFAKTTSLLKADEQSKKTDEPSKFEEAAVKPVRDVLQALKNNRLLRLANLLQDNRILWALGITLYAVLMLAAWSTLLWLRPLWLLRINFVLQPYADFALPEWLGGVKLSVRDVLLLSFFHFRRRVLDAWVNQHIAAARANFQRRDTVRDRNIYVPVPVVLDGNTVANLEPAALPFKKNRTCLLIWGEGGSGKTSLACQIAQWAMAEQPAERLQDHLMLPVLLEHELDPVTAGQDPLRIVIRGQLQALIDEAEEIDAALFERLLRCQRILVVVDRFSELSPQTREQIRPGQPDFPVGALVVTSRGEEELDGVPRTLIKPLRVTGNRLSSFLEAYLVRRGKRELFDDAEYFDACRRLSLMVGDRDITVLLAKMYADLLIGSRLAQSADDLPDNIPDLMLGYLNEINRSVTAKLRLDDRTVHQDVKILAWECLKETYRPSCTGRAMAIKALGGDDAEIRIKYLDERLRVIRTLGPARERLRFALDPLAEYLAGLHLVDVCGKDEEQWRELLRLDELPPPKAIEGFLLAVRDACLARREVAVNPDVIFKKATPDAVPPSTRRPEPAALAAV
jgi:HEAT repeat protein